MNKRVEIEAVRFANWVLEHFTSKLYQKRLEQLLILGNLKVMELMAQAQVMESRVEDQPGWDPVSNVVIEKEN